ncbi:MAG TPA: undecaprenyl-diphosphate phosphatase, partial [Azospirillaceae bacterium]|nr:undecaprenyl-diphosphate phosphatase [Azospirillaceae bacterium]
MALETYINALVLGIAEGLTEFIPVSSTGHLILLGDLLGFQGPPGKVFEVAIQLGAILAVCVVYFGRLWHVASRLHTDPGARRFVTAVLLGFLPALAIGFFAHGFIKSVLFNPTVVCISLITGGILILAVERYLPASRFHEVEALPVSVSLRIGLFQCIAMIPGVSRSGATIIGGLLMGVDRK